jgi:signal peptidase I
MIGVFTGYNKTIYSLRFSYLYNTVFITALVVVSEEIIRYIIARNSVNTKKPIIIYTLILILLNTITEISGYKLYESEGIFIFVSVVVLPVISRELLCSYLTYKVSYLPSLIFKLSMVLYELVMPIIPNLGYYLYASSNIFVCYLIYFLTSKSIDKASKVKTNVKVSNVRILYVPIILFLVGVVLLVSGLLNYQMIAIGSGSMVPAYYRGDAVIFKKVEPETVEKGDIIVFRKDGIVITHRIVNIYDGDSSRIIKTKGDANDAEDSFIVYDSEILGVVKCRVKYIGYPTIWLNELFEGREIND